MKELAGMKALVTGGSRGIGAATALLFAEWGVDVAIGYRSRAAEANTVVQRARALGVNATAIAADIGDREGAEQLIGAAVKQLNGIDFFVGNSGIWVPNDVSLTEMSDDQWHRTLRENLDSVFFTTRAAARVINDRGRIVLVASTAGQRGEAYHADYAASKGAMISFVKSLCVEMARRDITVNCVAPGWVDTEMAALPYASGGRAKISAGIPLGRVADPRDIAGPIVFLCSTLARHITGEILNVNGGSVLVG
ncbi:MAG TPA: SDR family oxidoreductase [Gemmatimonadaceae bacterium]|nr:SDR family oxidoreductase [Gemmatimonadaceae bacterium]